MGRRRDRPYPVADRPEVWRRVMCRTGFLGLKLRDVLERVLGKSPAAGDRTVLHERLNGKRPIDDPTLEALARALRLAPADLCDGVAWWPLVQGEPEAERSELWRRLHARMGRIGVAPHLTELARAMGLDDGAGNVEGATLTALHSQVSGRRDLQPETLRGFAAALDLRPEDLEDGAGWEAIVQVPEATPEIVAAYAERLSSAAET